MNLTRVIAVTQTANMPSRGLLEKLGMKLLRKYERYRAEQTLYTIDKKLFFSRNKHAHNGILTISPFSNRKGSAEDFKRVLLRQ